jgi:DNA-binding MarR family transcriptional regulator
MQVVAVGAHSPEETIEDLLVQAVQIVYFAHRSMTSEANDYLASHDLGRAHYRALHFTACVPGITVGELASMLKISNQALNRVLSHLLSHDYMRQAIDPGDARRRRLFLTGSGAEVERTAMSIQALAMKRSFDAVGLAGFAQFERFLSAMMFEDDRNCLDTLRQGLSGRG